MQAGVQKVLNLKSVPSTSTEAQSLIDKYKFFYFSKYPVLPGDVLINQAQRENRPYRLQTVEDWDVSAK